MCYVYLILLVSGVIVYLYLMLKWYVGLCKVYVLGFFVCLVVVLDSNWFDRFCFGKGCIDE